MTDFPDVRVYIDLDNDGTFDTGGDDNISAYVQEVSIIGGIADPYLERTASIGTCQITLENTDRRFSPSYASSPYYNRLLPNRRVRVDVVTGATSRTLFRGRIQSIGPDAGQYESLLATLLCEDAMSEAQSAPISLPLIQSQNAAFILKQISSDVYHLPAARGVAAIIADPVSDDMITLGELTYTFTAITPSSPYEVLIGADEETTADNLAAAVNAAEGAGTLYGTNTLRNPKLSASREYYDAVHAYLLADIVAYWRLNEDAGATLAEDTTDANRYGIPTAVTFGETGMGDDYTAASFDGSTSYVNAYSISLRNAFSGAAGTLAVWAKVDGAARWSDTTKETIARFAVDADNYIEVGIGADDDLHWIYCADGTVEDVAKTTSSTDWMFLVLTWDATADEVKAYYNGAQEGSTQSGLGTWAGTPASTGAVIGADNTTPDAPWGGSLAHVALWDDVLSAEAVAALYTFQDVALIAVARGAWGNVLALSTSSLIHLAASLTITIGSIESGTLADTYTQNGVYLKLNEVTGAVGFDYQFTFSGITGTAQSVKLYGRYEGNVGHVVEVLAWNGSTWDTLDVLPHSVVDADYTFALTGSHTIAGVVLVRIFHASAGSSAHDLYIDFLRIVDDTASPSDGIYLSGTTLLGGVDGPMGLYDYEDGVLTMEYAADLWKDGETSAMDAIDDVARSEYGFFWVAADGTLTFKDQQYQFLAANRTPDLTLSDTHNIQEGTLTIDDIYNRVSVTYRPRLESTTEVVARDNSKIYVPSSYGRRRTKRYNRTKFIRRGNGKIVIIPYVDADSKQTIGATELVLPPVAGTDFSIYDTSDTSGFNYTNSGYVTFSVALTGGGVQVTADNQALGPLYIHGLQFRGKKLSALDPVQSIVDDPLSQYAYGVRELAYDIPFPATTISVFAEALSDYLLSRYKDPSYRISILGFEGITTIGAVNIYDLALGDVVSVTETQTAIAAQKCLLLGYEYILVPDGVSTVRFNVMPLDDQTYWILGETGYSELGETTWLGL